MSAEDLAHEPADEPAEDRQGTPTRVIGYPTVEDRQGRRPHPVPVRTDTGTRARRVPLQMTGSGTGTFAPGHPRRRRRRPR